MRIVECRGTARDMGRQYGEQAREDILANVELWGEPRFPATPDFVNGVRRVFAAHAPEVLEEMEGIAEGAGVSFASIALMNQQNNFTAHMPSPGCTTIGMRHIPIIGKNNDIVYDGRRYVVRKCYPESGIPTIHVIHAGWLSGQDGMNAEGLACVHNSAGSRFDRTGDRIDVRPWGHRLLATCRMTAEYLKGLGAVPLTGKGFNIGLADAEGDACIVEAPVPRFAVRGRNDDFIYATNHYALDEFGEADNRNEEQKAISQKRFTYLASTSPPRSLEALMGLFRSHDRWAPCRHGGEQQDFTAWSLICLPAERRMLVSDGPPCTAEYREYTL